MTLALVVASGTPAASDQDGFRKEVGGFIVYLAVMPADVLLGPGTREEHAPDVAPFHRSPAVRDTHHLMVSVFESGSGRRVGDARVEARVAELGFSGERKRLAPTNVSGSMLYGGLYPMMGRGPFRVDVEFLVPGAQRPERVRFYFTHPSFAEPGER